MSVPRFHFAEIPWWRGGDRWPILLAYENGRPVYRRPEAAHARSSRVPASHTTTARGSTQAPDTPAVLTH